MGALGSGESVAAERMVAASRASPAQLKSTCKGARRVTWANQHSEIQRILQLG